MGTKAKVEHEFELKTSDGIKKWVGTDGPNAAYRYADAHPGIIVRAYRFPKYEIVVGPINIIG